MLAKRVEREKSHGETQGLLSTWVFFLLTLLSDQVLAGFVFCWLWESLFLKEHREKFVLLNQPQNCQEEEAVALVQQCCSELRIFQRFFIFLREPFANRLLTKGLKKCLSRNKTCSYDSINCIYFVPKKYFLMFWVKI